MPAELPPISIVQPLCGIETFSKQTLASIFALDYPDYEIVFCLADGADPIVPLVRRFMAAHPQVPSRLLIGDDRISANPKLNNVVKGWKAARHGWICIADSNVLMPPDYLKRFISSWRPNSGIVCSPPIGSSPESFAAEVECAFLNTYEARWQYASERVGNGFAQGKNMFWRRDVLEAGGGIDALGVEIAEDAASTKLVLRQGLRAHLVDRPFAQPLGSRTLREVWKRQLRWARLRRATFVGHFAAEIITTSLLAIGAAAVAAPEFGLEPARRRCDGGRDLVRRGGDARRRLGLAAQPLDAARLGRARHRAAMALAAGLARGSVRVARQHDLGQRRGTRGGRRRAVRAELSQGSKLFSKLLQIFACFLQIFANISLAVLKNFKGLAPGKNLFCPWLHFPNFLGRRLAAHPV